MIYKNPLIIPKKRKMEAGMALYYLPHATFPCYTFCEIAGCPWSWPLESESESEAQLVPSLLL